MGTRAEMREKIEAYAQARVDAGDRLIDAGKRLEEAEVLRADAVRDYKSAWAEAVKSGWTATDLKRYGFKNLGAVTRVKPRPKARTTASQEATEAVNESEHADG